jgi:hypothetical protein
MTQPTALTAKERFRGIEESVEGGIVAGIASAFVNFFVLCFAGIIAKVGFDAPMYAVIGVVDEGTAITKHFDQLNSGWCAWPFGSGDGIACAGPTFQQEAFMLGFAACLLLGAISGIIFMIGMRKYPIRGPKRYLVGALHGIVMMCIFYVGVLGAFDLAGFDSDAVSLATLLGWPAMFAIHAIHGVVLAAIMRTQLTRTDNVFQGSMGA